MKRFVIAAILTALAGAAWAAPPRDLDRRVDALRTQIGVPGVAVAIVEDGKVTYARGFGVKQIDRPERVDADTIFPTGSTGKAFTVAALATLVDAGRIGWDDKVIDRLPGFQMYDPWVTREMTIRDLLVHRSGLGLGAGDLLFVPRTNLTRAESVRRLRFIKPATSFRSGFAYDNVLYMVAGQLIEAVTGDTWEQYTLEHVLKPAGMLHSTSGGAERFANPNRAQPHARMDGGMRGVGHQELLNERDELGRTAAPAGGLAVSANDMARWLLIQLQNGELPEHNGRLFSQAAHEAMWAPLVPQPISPLPDSLKTIQPMFSSYALGWEIQDYRGARIVWHGGAVFGAQTVVVLLPGQEGRLLHRDQLRGQRAAARPDERNARSLPGICAHRLDRAIPGLQAAENRGGLAALRQLTAQPANGRAVAAARRLCRQLRRRLVRQHRSRCSRWQAQDRLQVDAAHERRARALAVRHFRHALRRQERSNRPT